MCCDLAGVLLLLPGPCHQGEEEGAGGVGQVDLLHPDHDDDDSDVVDLRLADERELACRRTSAALLLTSPEDTLLRSGSTFVILTITIIKSNIINITVIKSSIMTRRGDERRQLADLAGPKGNHSSSPQVKLHPCLELKYYIW